MATAPRHPHPAGAGPWLALLAAWLFWGCAPAREVRPAPRLLVLLTEGFSGEELRAFHPAPAADLPPSVSPLASLLSRLSATPVAEHGFHGLALGHGIDPSVPLWTRALAEAGWNSRAFWARPQLDLAGLGFERAALEIRPSDSRGPRGADAPDRLLARAAASAPSELLLLHLVRPDFPQIPPLSAGAQSAALASLSTSDPRMGPAFSRVQRAAQGPSPFAAALEQYGRAPEREILALWQQALWAAALRAELERWSADWPQDAQPLVLLLGLSGTGSPPEALWSPRSAAQPAGSSAVDPRALAGLMTPLGLARLERGPGGRFEPVALELGALELGAPEWPVPLAALAAALDPQDPDAASALRAFAERLPKPGLPRCQGIGAWAALELGPEGPCLIDRRARGELPADLVFAWPAAAPPVEFDLRGLQQVLGTDLRLASSGLERAARLHTTLEPGARFEVWSEFPSQPLRLSLRDPAARLTPELAFSLAADAAPPGWILCAWLPEPGPLWPADAAPAALELSSGPAPQLKVGPGVRFSLGLEGRLGPWPPLNLRSFEPAPGPPWPWPAGHDLWLAEFDPIDPPALRLGEHAPRSDRLEFVLRWPEPEGHTLTLPGLPAEAPAAAPNPAPDPAADPGPSRPEPTPASFLQLRLPRGPRLPAAEPAFPWH